MQNIVYKIGMKKSFIYVAMMVMSTVMLLTACNGDEPLPAPVVINYHFASKSEGQQLMASNTAYYNSLNQNDIDWRMKRTGATLDELKALGQASVCEFSGKEKKKLAEAVKFVGQRLAALGVGSLPFPQEDIVFVKTTTDEEPDAGAYTHGTVIYVGGPALKEKLNNKKWMHYAVAHELFHCLTRNSPDFRRKMYSLIGFTATGTDFTFSPEITEKIFTNPDVEHYDSYAEFTIEGIKRRCTLMALYTAAWAEAYAEVGEEASFFDFSDSYLVPIDALDTYYPISEVPDFWDVVGKNTDYVLAPEECMADNFAFAVVYGAKGLDYETPELIEALINSLKEEYGVEE